MSTQPADQPQRSDATFAIFVAECIAHWRPAVLVAALAGVAAWMSTSISGPRRTVNFLVSGPSELVDGMLNPADTAQFLGTLDVDRVIPAIDSIASTVDRSATLVSVVARLGPEVDDLEAAKVPQSVVDQANAAIETSLDATRGMLRDALSTSERSLADAERMLALLAAQQPAVDGEAVASVLQQVASLRNVVIEQRRRITLLRGLRAVGAPALRPPQQQQPCDRGGRGWSR